MGENQRAENYSLSVIDNLNLNQVQQIMGKIAQFQSVVQKTLKKEHDFGVIPGTGNKPTLLKPGAEKILMMMGVSSEYELIEKVQDYERGFFAYTVRCILKRNGEMITQGLGHCNTREKRYQSDKQDPYTLANTCLKMAKKRSQIDATLTIASLSELFTQDVEDMYPAGNGSSNGSGHKNENGNWNGNKQKSPRAASEKQLSLIRGKMNEAGFDSKDPHTVQRLLKMGGLEKDSLQQLTVQDASLMIGKLDNYLHQMTAPPPEPPVDEGIHFNQDEVPF